MPEFGNPGLLVRLVSLETQQGGAPPGAMEAQQVLRAIEVWGRPVGRSRHRCRRPCPWQKRAQG